MLWPFDSFAAAMALPSGVPGTWLFSMSSPSKVPRQMPIDTGGMSHLELRVVGTEGSLLVSRSRVEIYAPDGATFNTTGPLTAAHSVAEALRDAARAFAGAGPADGSGPEEAIADLE